MDPPRGHVGPQRCLSCAVGQAEAVRPVREDVNRVGDPVSGERLRQEVRVFRGDVGVFRCVPDEERLGLPFSSPTVTGGIEVSFH
jgi:hypothetical protein